MLKSSKYVIEMTINPAKELYDKTINLSDEIISKENKEVIKKIYDQSQSAKVVISRFKRTGDLYKYLLKSISSSLGNTKTTMRNLNLTPFEDIINDFERLFYDELKEITNINNFIENEEYTTWDFIFLADTYRTQTTGILGVYGWATLWWTNKIVISR